MVEIERLTHPVSGMKYRVYSETENGQKYLRVGSGSGTQGVGGYGPTGLYFDDIADVIGVGKKAVLMLGVGCGTVARLLRERGSKAHIIGVDNDPVLIGLARRHFAIEQHLDVIVEEDARTYLERVLRTPAHPLWDVVVLDCYVGDERSAVSEALALAAVAPDGKLIVNHHAAGEGERLQIIQKPIV